MQGIFKLLFSSWFLQVRNKMLHLQTRAGTGEEGGLIFFKYILVAWPAIYESVCVELVSCRRSRRLTFGMLVPFPICFFWSCWRKMGFCSRSLPKIPSLPPLTVVGAEKIYFNFPKVQKMQFLYVDVDLKPPEEF